MAEEEYELIPLSPLRRLEKRIERLEASSSFNAKEFYKEMVDIIRINQQIVSELVKANDALRLELSRLPSRLEELVSKLDELLTLVKAASEEAPTETKPKEQIDLLKKIDELIEANKKISENLERVLGELEEIEKRMKRPIVPIRKPLIPPSPKL